MKSAPRPFVVERRSLPARAAPGQPDDAAELRAVAAALQDVPRESLASMADLLFHLRRCGRRIVAVAVRVERAQDERRPGRVRPAAEARRQAERAFRPAAGAGTMRLPRRAAGQMELGI